MKSHVLLLLFELFLSGAPDHFLCSQPSCCVSLLLSSRVLLGLGARAAVRYEGAHIWLGWVSSAMVSPGRTGKRDGEVVPRNTQKVTDEGHCGLPAPKALLGPASGTGLELAM